MSNIFISYSRQREAIVRTLTDDIQALGHTVWFDQDFLKTGFKIFALYYCIVIFVIFTNFGFTMDKDMDTILARGASLIFLLLLSVFTKKRQHEPA